MRCKNELPPITTNMAGSMNNTIGIVSLAPNLCALSSSLVIRFSPEVGSDTAQSLAQRRSVLQALAHHGSESLKSIRRRSEFIECVAAIWQYPEIIKKTG